MGASLLLARLRTKQKADDWVNTKQEPDSFPQLGDETLHGHSYTWQAASKGDKVQTFALRIQVLVPPSAALPPVGSRVASQKVKSFMESGCCLKSWGQRGKFSP